jgi:hypothetical protein
MPCVTDSSIPYPPPPVSRPSSAGGIYTDPTFHTTIMRITDESDGVSNQVAYSYWPSFNRDSSRLLIWTADLGATLYAFNPDTFTLDLPSKAALPLAPSGNAVQWEGATWSGSDPNILYACEGLNLWQCDAATGTYTLLNDFAGDVTAHELWQMSMSEDDTTFAVSLRNTGHQVIGYAVWRTDRGLILNESTPAPPNPHAVNEVHIDKTGRFLVVACEDETQGMQVWDLHAGTLAPVDVPDKAPGYAPGHYDTGRGTLVGHDNQLNRTTCRRLSDPLDVTTVLDLGCDWNQDYHVSMLADDETKAVISLYFVKDVSRDCSTENLFRDEILQVSTDGSQTLCRLAHHRSQVADPNPDEAYANAPHANISRDGRFVAYTSNWDGSGQRDVFAVRVP